MTARDGEDGGISTVTKVMVKVVMPEPKEKVKTTRSMVEKKKKIERRGDRV